MIMKAQKRLSAGLTSLSAFTWSKNIDNELAGGNFFSDPPAFFPAASYTYGNLARTIDYRGPGMKNWDISLFKNFAITERFNAEFRVEALNAFNSPGFPNPNTKYESASFGTITSQVSFSRLLQLGVRFAF